VIHTYNKFANNKWPHDKAKTSRFDDKKRESVLGIIDEQQGRNHIDNTTTLHTSINSFGHSIGNPDRKHFQ
jgi:hypothetical protein